MVGWWVTSTGTVVDKRAVLALGPFDFNLLPYSDEYGSRPRLAGWMGIGAV